MKSVSLTSYPRQLSKRTGAKKVRTTGRVPAVIYGRQTTPQNLEVPLLELEEIVAHSASENMLVDLLVTGDPKPKRLALVKSVQHHPLTGAMLHVDLQEVVETEKVTITVPVESTGEPVGVKVGGGVLEHVLFNLKVRALPKDLPEQIVVDVSHLEVGKAVHIGDITPPNGVEVLGDKRIVVMAVAVAMKEVEEAAPAEGAAAEAAVVEPEMIKEKKEEGAAGSAPEKGKEAGKEEKKKK